MQDQSALSKSERGENEHIDRASVNTLDLRNDDEFANRCANNRTRRRCPSSVYKVFGKIHQHAHKRKLGSYLASEQQFWVGQLYAMSIHHLSVCHTLFSLRL